MCVGVNFKPWSKILGSLITLLKILSIMQVIVFLLLHYLATILHFAALNYLVCIFWLVVLVFLFTVVYVFTVCLLFHFNFFSIFLLSFLVFLVVLLVFLKSTSIEVGRSINTNHFLYNIVWLTIELVVIVSTKFSTNVSISGEELSLIYFFVHLHSYVLSWFLLKC